MCNYGVSGASLGIKLLVERVSVRFKHTRVEITFKCSYAVKCGNHLRAEVRAENASVSGLRVGLAERCTACGCPPCMLVGEGEGSEHVSQAKAQKEEKEKAEAAERARNCVSLWRG